MGDPERPEGFPEEPPPEDDPPEDDPFSWLEETIAYAQGRLPERTYASKSFKLATGRAGKMYR